MLSHSLDFSVHLTKFKANDKSFLKLDRRERGDRERKIGKIHLELLKVKLTKKVRTTRYNKTGQICEKSVGAETFIVELEPNSALLYNKSHNYF